MAMTKREQTIKAVHRLWKRGERLNAIRAADEAKLKDDEKPDGMEAHRARMRPALR